MAGLPNATKTGSLSTGDLGTTRTHGGVLLLVRECGDCGVVWAMSETFWDNRRQDGRTWYCPNGHRWHFPGETEEEKLKRQLKRERQNAGRLAAELDQAEASRSALKGVVTKQRQKLERVAKGVCPCCNRSFADLKKHMVAKHPEWKGQPQ